MEEINWDSVQKGQHLVVRQNVQPKGPRRQYFIEWCGVVTEHSPKWTRLKYDKEEMSVPTQWGEEVILKLSKAEFTKYMKENYG